jgi:hypothetical protein
LAKSEPSGENWKVIEGKGRLELGVNQWQSVALQRAVPSMVKREA